MILFRSNNPGAEIFISVGTGCPTGCQSCHKTLKENSSLPLDQIKYQLKKGNELSSNNFSFFIYGNDALENPHMSEILEFIKQIGRHVKIQIPVHTQYPQLEKFINHQDTSIFIVSKKVESKKQILEIITSIQNLHGKGNIFINYDLLIDLEHKTIFEKVFKTLSIEEELGIFSIRFENVKITLRSLYYINYIEKRIDKLQLESCIIYDSFSIQDNCIQIHDHFEIEPSGDITFHNPLCYIGQPKVTNIEKNHTEIIGDFIKYKEGYLSTLNTDLEKNCFTCISSRYTY